MSYKRARSWINKKISLGESPEKLKACVGAFSNKKKKDVMKEKKLSSNGYDKRYSFLYDVYFLLDSEKF